MPTQLVLPLLKDYMAGAIDAQPPQPPKKSRKFDESDHPRHPAGTPIDPATGAGGGRFAPKDSDLVVPVGTGTAAGGLIDDLLDQQSFDLGEVDLPEKPDPIGEFADPEDQARAESEAEEALRQLDRILAQHEGQATVGLYMATLPTGEDADDADIWASWFEGTHDFDELEAANLEEFLDGQAQQQYLKDQGMTIDLAARMLAERDEYVPYDLKRNLVGTLMGNERFGTDPIHGEAVSTWFVDGFEELVQNDEIDGWDIENMFLNGNSNLASDAMLSTNYMAETIWRGPLGGYDPDQMALIFDKANLETMGKFALDRQVGGMDYYVRQFEDMKGELRDLIMDRNEGLISSFADNPETLEYLFEGQDDRAEGYSHLFDRSSASAPSASSLPSAEELEKMSWNSLGKPGNSGDAYYEVTDPDTGNQYFLKFMPERSADEPLKEYHSTELAALAGMPTLTMRPLKSEEFSTIGAIMSGGEPPPEYGAGVVMEMMDMNDWQEVNAFGGDNPGIYSDDLAKVALFDYLIGNPDRHGGNLLVDNYGDFMLVDFGWAGKYPENGFRGRGRIAHESVTWGFYDGSVDGEPATNALLDWAIDSGDKFVNKVYNDWDGTDFEWSWERVDGLQNSVESLRILRDSTDIEDEGWTHGDLMQWINREWLNR